MSPISAVLTEILNMTTLDQLGGQKRLGRSKFGISKVHSDSVGKIESEIILPQSTTSLLFCACRTLPQDLDGEIENSGKKHGKIRIPKFCYIQVIVIDLSYLPVAAVGTQQVRYYKKNVKNAFYIFHIFFIVAYLLSPNRCHWQIAKVNNYNLNVTELRDPDFSMLFPGIFNFTVEILPWPCDINEKIGLIEKIFIEEMRLK